MSDPSERKRKYDRKKNASVADIGEIPAVANLFRRRVCSENLGHFLQAYFPNGTGKGPFSCDHYDVIDIIQSCIMRGGWYANAVFREFAKTSIAEGAVLWAAMHGYRKNCPIVGAEEDSASEIIDSLQRELCENDLLYEDYPEVCHAFRHLEGRHQRCANQTVQQWGACPTCRGKGVARVSGVLSDCEECDGKGERFSAALTHINCVGNEIVLPSIKLTREQSEELGIPTREDGYTVGSGAIISAHGILSFKRGSKSKQVSGEANRPDFCIVDDFQTDASATSEIDTRRRLKKIFKGIIPSAGQRRKMAIVVNGTVIEKWDGMEQLLDPEKSRAWNGRRIPILRQRATPEAEKLWFGPYANILLSFDRNAANPTDEQDRARRQATQFYLDHQEQMDAGAVATWRYAYQLEEGEVSAIQHCYNIWIEQGDEVFLCEGQQQPKTPEDELRRLTAEQICGKANGIPRGMVPAWALKLTCHIDVQDSCLYWLVLATSEGFTSHVVDYGVYPEQPSGTMELQRVKVGFHTVRHVHPNMGAEGALRAAIDKLTMGLFGRHWPREDSRDQRLDWAVIDSADNSSLVYEAVRRSPYSAILRAARGWKFGAIDPSWEEFVAKFRRPTEEFFWHCWETPVEAGIRLFKMDSNHWKTFSFKRLSTAPGDVGCLTLFGSPGDHEEFSRQLLAPKGVVMKSEKGREVEEWKTQHGADDHLFDTLYGAFAAAARIGVKISSMPDAGRVIQQRRTFAIPEHLRSR